MGAAVQVTRRLAAFLLLTGGFQWLVWPGFLGVVLTDERAFDGGPTTFLLVHLAIVLPALVLATGLLVMGGRAWRKAPRRTSGGTSPDPAHADRAAV